MEFQKNLSIKYKLVAIILLVTFLAIAIGFTIVIVLDITEFKKDLLSKTEINAQLISEYCVAPLIFDDQKEVQTILEKLNVVPDIVTGCIYDTNGNLFAVYQMNQKETIPDRTTFDFGHKYEGKYLVLKQQILFKGENYGIIYLKASIDSLNDHIETLILTIISLILLLLLMSYLVAVKLQKIISVPILNLANITKEITSKDNFNVQVEKPGNDEVGILYDHFNSMLTQLHVREIERDEAEEILRLSEARFSQIVNSANEGIWELNSEDLIIFVNARITELLGYQASEMIEKPLMDFMLKEDIPDHLNRMQNCRQGLAENYERRLIHKNGKIVWTLAAATPIFDQDQNYKGSFAMIMDITDRKHAEEEIRTLNNELEDRVIQRTSQLEAAYKDLEIFAYSIAHDLRTPLRAIDGFSQILIEEYNAKIDNKGKDYLVRVRKATQLLGKLIDDMSYFSRISRSEINIERVNLSNIAQKIASDFQERNPDRKVEFIIQKKLIVKGDDRLLSIVLDNLIGNAWKFTLYRSKAQIEFGLQQQQGQKVYFLKDNGAGFEMDYANKLFRVFQRLHSASEFPGTGAGLAIVHSIISRHGGTVWAEGKVDQGATFYFTLP